MKNTYNFDFKQGEFVMSGDTITVITGIDALRLWIDKTLHTQTGRYSIYSGKNYGANVEDLIIGKSYGFDFIASELKREIETALLQHEDILSINNFTVQKNGTVLDVTFTLKTIYGNIDKEVLYDG